MEIVSNIYENGKGIITFNGNLTKVAAKAFTDCTSLETITLPESVTALGNMAFYGCSSLTDIDMPDTITSIGYAAFRHCNLKSFTIPSSLTSVDDAIFADCINLAEFKGKFASEDGRCLIVDGVLKSFAHFGVTEYTLPGSITKIGDEAFCCDSNLASVTIPDGVTEIGDYAFYWCQGLTSITIPDSVTSIGVGAFKLCYDLTSVFCERTTPPTANFEGYSSWGAFYRNAADRKIYVPTESVDAYKTADGWKDYADAIEPYDFE